MNKAEKRMLLILSEGKRNYHYAGVKSEFESEGARFDEMLVLAGITRKSGLNLGIKIGGCEAVSDLYNCKLFGADYIIAPMVETSYALKKYIEAKNNVYSKEERQDVRFLFNLETINSYNNLDSIIEQACVKDGADGIVFGRVDFVGSMGFSRDKILSDEISSYINETSKICKEKSLDFVIGGAVSNETISSVAKANEIYLSRFETRKIIFHSKALTMSQSELSKALELAVEFELLWLQNKRDYYKRISEEDESRIDMLELRFKKMKF